METFLINCLGVSSVVMIAVGLIMGFLCYFVYPHLVEVSHLDKKDLEDLISISKAVSMEKFGLNELPFRRVKLPSDAIGMYYCSTRHIAIDINKMKRENLNVKALITTIIHEYAHAWQHNVYEKFDADYDQWNNKVGYDNNPYELEARRLANKYYRRVIIKYFENEEV